MTIHKSMHWVFNVSRSDVDSIFEASPYVEVICNYEQLLV